jgi:hypothetical protein
MRVVALLALALFGLVACSSDDSSPGDGASPCQGDACPKTACTTDERFDVDAARCTPLGWRDCPAGFALDPSNLGCTDVAPADACPPLTMPVLGKTACAPVAAAACAAGFERDASGWGCRAVLPASACTGATMEALGQSTCVPVGDCAAAFPPVGATHFVDAAFTAGQVDATHFTTLGAALAAAPAGSVIAVQAGSYSETLTPPRSVRIAGKCAAQVTLTSPTGVAAGIRAKSGIALTVEGITMTGHLGALIAEGGATVTARAMVLDANPGGGVLVSGAGSKLTLDRSVVRKATAGTLSKGFGAEASLGAELVVTGSALTDNTEIGIHVVNKGSHGRIERSVVLRTAVDAAKDFGNGLVVRGDATADVVGSALVQNHDSAVVAFGAGTKVTLEDSSIADTRDSISRYGRGMLVDAATVTALRTTFSGNTDSGIVAEAKSNVTLTDSVVASTVAGGDGTNGIGIAAIQASTVTAKGSAIVGNHQSGVAALEAGAKIVLDGSLVEGTLTDTDGGRGYGIDLESGGLAEVRGSAITNNTTAGIGLLDKGSKLTMSGSIVRATRADASKKGGAGVAVEGGAAAAISGSAMIGNRDTGIAVRGAGSSATIDQVIVRDTLPQASTGAHGRGIEVGSGGKASVNRTTLLRNRSSSLVSIAAGSSLDVQNTWIADTADEPPAGARGRAATVQDGAVMTMLGVVAQRSLQAGFVVAGAGSSLVATSSRVEDVGFGAEDGYGHGVIALDGAAAVLDDVTVSRALGVGVVYDASRGTLRACHVTNNAVGIYAQGGTELQQVATVPDAPNDGVVAVSTDTEFTGNTTRVGSGVVPVPSPL